MKPQSYHVTMDNGVQLDIEAFSAGEAIHHALHRARGHRVRSCVLGSVRDPDEGGLLPGEGHGQVTFEVPPHHAIPFEPQPGRQKMCAKYVRAGYILEHEVFDYVVEHVRPTEAGHVTFEVRQFIGSSFTDTQTTVSLRPDRLVTVYPAPPRSS